MCRIELYFVLGQKCSTTSRLFVAESIWPELKEYLVSETNKLSIGPVIHQRSWEKLDRVIRQGKSDSSLQLLAGGQTDRSKGWFVQPTIFQTSDRNHEYLKSEFFGPVLTVYVYPDAEYEQTLSWIDASTKFALTGSVFARDRAAVQLAEDRLRQAAGNFYINSKRSGAVVGHQPFGGARPAPPDTHDTSPVTAPALFEIPEALLQPRKNPLLHSLLKKTLYNHFCAGENHGEVTSTIRRIKDMGFRGVILTYAKEVVVDSSQSEVGKGTQQLEEAEQADVDLFLATHNKKSTLAAYEQQAARAVRSVLHSHQLKAGGAGPEAYKCLSWGSLDDCLSYLIRPAVENRDAVSRTVTEYQALKREVWRRLRATVGLS
ncbi:hypothetical protein LQW54_010314 [Pestalotiopsis sp. IQ-011]